MQNQQVVVVGGGIVGCMTALALSKRGCQVTVVERNQIAAQTSGESSWAGAGILFPLLPWDYRDEVNNLALRGASLYPQICAELKRETGVDPEYTQSGMLILPPFDSAKAQVWCEQNSVETENWHLKTVKFSNKDGKTVKYAGLNAEKDGFLLKNVGQVRPPHLLQALKQMLLKSGVILRENTQLKPLENQTKINNWQTTTGETLTAEKFVVTSGAWSFELLKNTQSDLNIKPMRGQILLYKTDKPLIKNIIYQNGFYLVPRRDGYLLAGSSLEDVGFDARTTDEMRQKIQTQAEQLLPELKTQTIVKHWSGLRPGTPENLPTIAAHPAIKNLYLNTGHFRYGLTMAPASADLVTELVCA